MATSIYDFTADSLDGKPVSLASFKNQVLLIVNVASKCGFTPQYTGLEQLFQKYRERGLVILGFPCNQFGGQEPGSAADIKQFCSLTYPVSFPMFNKVDVNGNAAHPLYQYLKSQKSGVLGTEGVKWNFTKFLIDRQGNVIERYAPTTKPESIAADIEKLLA